MEDILRYVKEETMFDERHDPGLMTCQSDRSNESDDESESRI